MGWGGRYSKGRVNINLAEVNLNTHIKWTMEPTLDFSMEPRDGVGVRLCVGAALRLNSGMTVGPALGVFLGLSNGIAYVPVEGNQYGINVRAGE